jgi:SAM-dependent methyltransferase
MQNNQDTRAKLRNMFAAEGGPRAIFSNKVADYVASRPDYPPALFEALTARCAIDADKLVVDIGSGTGLLTQGLLRCGYRVVAVEPNAEMRAEADARFRDNSNFRSADGCAESIPLSAGTADLITAAQAFHWFEVDQARTEFLRVLTPTGSVALIWNDRTPDDPLQQALDALFSAYGGAKRGALVAHEDRSKVSAFFGANKPEQLTWPHEHRLDEAGLLSLVFSRSYMPGRETETGRSAARQASKIFLAFASSGLVVVRYQTIVFLGRPA